VVSSVDESEARDEREHGESRGPAAGTLIGRVLAERYEIERELGRGGMGVVYRARHVTLGRPVAIKVLHTKLTADPAVSKRFDREALAASKLDHPNCVQVIDFGRTDDGLEYLVMQFLDGKELRDELGWPMNHRRAARLAAQVLRALEHAHRKGLVHRDLKPENVFIVRDDDGEEHVKLVDFGIVKLLDAEGVYEKLTRAGLVFGTPRYMAPEQAAGGKIDERTDLYAVGVLLHEMLRGKPPFDADEAPIVLRMHMIADPPPLPADVPKPLREIVDKLLAKSPGERPASAKEAREALDAIVAMPAKAAAQVSSEVVPEQSALPPLQAPAPPLRVSPVAPAPAAAAVPVAPPPSASRPTMPVAVPPTESTRAATLAFESPRSPLDAVPSRSGATLAIPQPAMGTPPVTNQPSMSGPRSVPPSGAFKTVVALQAQTDLRIPRRRTGGAALAAVLVAVGVAALVLYGILAM
jgi:eukaryotic-like serine/threonine-protein kinase